MTDSSAGLAGLDSSGYQRLLEDAGDAIIAADVQGRIIFCNAAAAKLFGYPTESMIGKPASRLIAARHQEEFERGFDAELRNRDPKAPPRLTVACTADGQEFPVEISVSVSGRGHDAVAIGIVRKVRERFKKLALLQESERRLREAERVAGMGSFEWDAVSNKLSWSDELDRIYGYAPGEHPESFEEFLQHVHPDDREAVKENVQRSLTSGLGWSMDERIVRRDTRETRVLASSVRAMRDASGKVVRLCGICHDVTEQRRAEEALAASEARFRHGFDDAPIGMLLVELRGDDGAIKRTNKALARLLSYSQKQLARTPLSNLIAPNDWPLLRAMLVRVRDTGSTTQIELRLRAKDGTTPIAIVAASRIEGEDAAPALIVHFEDVTPRKDAEKALRHRALHDHLTGLANRELLLDRLNGSLARAERQGTSVAVLYLDLDDFKIINATKGRNAGDEILRTVATRLTECARHGDTAARAGSDEFAVICENIADQEEVSLLAQRIGRVLAAPIAIGEEQFNTSVSIGISMGRRAGTADQLLRDADLAMHRAKQRGRNAIEMFDEALRWHAMDRFELERDLRRGLQEREIVPYYQPIMELRSGRLSGFEALARWRHPRRGLLRPAQFLSIAEDAQLIGALGAAMLEAACKQLAQWRLTRADLTMAVNLSLRQLDGTYRRHLAEKIEECGIPPEAIHLEVTESVLLDMQSSAAANLNALASMGLCLGIDDFGTGYSSMVYLKRFPVRFLKIDRSFVDGLPDQSEDSAIVDAIIRLGQSLDIATIAEGVETAEQLDALRRLGCRFAQGYYIAPPRAAEECALD